MTNKPPTQKETLTAQQRNEEFFEQVSPEFSADMEIYTFKGLKKITIYKNSNYGSSFLIEMRFQKWQQAAKREAMVRFLRHPWFETKIYKEDVYRTGKSLFIRKLLF